MCEKEGRSSLIHPLRVSGKCRDKKETKRKPNIYQNILFILASRIELAQVLWVSREELGTTHNQEQEGDWKALVSQARGHTLGWLEQRFKS